MSEGEDKPEEEEEEEESRTEARTSDIGQGLSTDVLKELVRLRTQEGLTIREIADKTGIPKSTVGDVLKGISTSSQGSRGPPQYNGNQGEAPILREPPQTAPGVYLSPQALLNLRSMLSPSQQRVFDGQVAVSTMEMQRSQPMAPYTAYVSPSDEVDREIARLIRVKTVQNLTKENPSQQQQGVTSKDVLDIIAVVSKLTEGKGGEGSNPLAYFLEGVKFIRENPGHWSAQETIQYLNALAERDKETRKSEVAMEVVKQIPQTVQNVADIVRGVGSSKAARLPMTNVKCLACGKPFPIPAIVPHGANIPCPQCGEPVPPELLTFQPEQAPPVQTSATMTIPCTCDAIIEVKPDESGKFPTSVTCPTCGKIHTKQAKKEAT